MAQCDACTDAARCNISTGGYVPKVSVLQKTCSLFLPRAGQTVPNRMASDYSIRTVRGSLLLKLVRNEADSHGHRPP